MVAQGKLKFNYVSIIGILSFVITSKYFYIRMAEESASGCITVRDVPAPKFIAAYADVLKNNDKFQVPKWVDTVKTGVSRELAPYNPDWYFIRAGTIKYFSIVILSLTLSYVFMHFSVHRKKSLPQTRHWSWSP